MDQLLEHASDYRDLRSSGAWPSRMLSSTSRQRTDALSLPKNGDASEEVEGHAAQRQLVVKPKTGTKTSAGAVGRPRQPKKKPPPAPGSGGACYTVLRRASQDRTLSSGALGAPG